MHIIMLTNKKCITDYKNSLSYKYVKECVAQAKMTVDL